MFAAEKPHFNQAALQFLRGLKRHNDRDWFTPRKPIFDAELKAPMLAVIGAVNDALPDFAPEFLRDPAKCIFRIYRDTRFSANKLPYKDHVAAWWARHGLEKTSGAGFYFQVGATQLTIAAGCYMPQKDQLLAIRRHLLDHHERFRKLAGAKKLERLGMTAFEPLKMSRPPKGFAADHPASGLIMQRQWGLSAHLPAEIALQPALVDEILERFRAAAPLVSFLNEPLLPAGKTPLF